MKIKDIYGKFIVCGHRGYAAKYPENTMAGFIAAADLGVDMLELDVVISRDGVPVICHDYELDRTSDGHGPLADYTLKELRKFNMAAKFGDGAAVEHISTFEEFCEMLQNYPEMLINIDMKFDDGFISDKAADLVERYGYEERCVFNGLNGKGIAAMHDRGFFTEASPDGFYRMQNFDWVYSGANRKIEALCLNANKDVNKEQVARLKAMGVEVWAWGADDSACVNNLIDCGVTLALCNDPVPCMEVAKERGVRVYI